MLPASVKHHILILSGGGQCVLSRRWHPPIRLHGVTTQKLQSERSPLWKPNIFYQVQRRRLKIVRVMRLIRIRHGFLTERVVNRSSPSHSPSYYHLLRSIHSCRSRQKLPSSLALLSCLQCSPGCNWVFKHLRRTLSRRRLWKQNNI
jgi:hypothetical protein